MPTPIVEYNVSDAAIAKLKEKYDGLFIATTEDYEVVRSAIAECRTLRVAVEKTRVELKADALAYGRKVDAEAKRITSALLEVEEPLKLEKKKVDDEKERIRREKEEAEKAEQDRIHAEAEAKRKAEEEAERERIRKEQEAENARLHAERESLAKERAEAEEKARIEREKIEAERRVQEEKLAQERAKLQAEQERLDRERFEREAKERAERAAREKAEREAAAKEAAERKAAEEARIAAERLPDKEKLLAFADALNAVETPALSSQWGKDALADADQSLGEIIDILRAKARTESNVPVAMSP